MECVKTKLKDTKLIKPKVFTDPRGFFLESWRQNAYDELLNNGKPLRFIQDNHSKSTHHVLRGMHFQYRHPQGKLIRVLSGGIYDVIIDLRLKSPTYGQWEGIYLTAENKYIFWIPPGFAHGFYTLSDNTEIFYKCTEYYHPEDERVIIWNDCDLNISWPLSETSPPDLSDKDSIGVTFKNAPKYESL